jgi:Protein of unknown function (DUF2806)
MFEVLIAAIKTNAPAALGKVAHFVGLRLLGKLIELPEVWLDGKIQILKDDRDAKSGFAKAIAAAAASSISNNLDLIDAASAYLLNDYIRKFNNKAAVYNNTLKILSEHHSEEQKKAKIPNDDWLNNFTSYAEDASSEHMREAFSRILAGEILHSGTFSRAAMRFMYEMTTEVARAFAYIWQKSIDGRLPVYLGGHRIDNGNRLHSYIKSARDAGLIHSNTLYNMGRKDDISNSEYVMHYLKFGNHVSIEAEYRYKKEQIFPKEAAWGYESFTKIALEISSILPPPKIEQNLRNFATVISNQENLYRILLTREDGTVEVLPILDK